MWVDERARTRVHQFDGALQNALQLRSLTKEHAIHEMHRFTRYAWHKTDTQSKTQYKSDYFSICAFESAFSHPCVLIKAFPKLLHIGNN